MTTQFILIEAVIPATGDYQADHDIMVALKPAIDALKEAVHGLPGKGSVTVKTGKRKKAPNNTAKVPE